jgi:hypothetical protein
MAGMSTGVAAGIGGLIALAAAGTAVPSAMRLKPATPAMCQPGETPLFACAIGAKQVAVCGRGGTAVYRFGRPGQVELTSTALTMAMRGFAGGGETQITAANKDFRYTVFDRTTRTAFGDDGRHDAAMNSGLLIHRAGRIVATSRCSGDATISAKATSIVKPGPFVPH